MNREVLEKYIGETVTIRFKDGEIAKGRLEKDKYNKKRFSLVRQILCNIDFSAYLVVEIGVDDI